MYAHCKNYNLRTAQETITNCSFFFSFSLWGKFGERQNKPVTHCITQPSELFQLLEDPVNEIHSVRICSDDVMELVVSKAEDEFQRSFKQNVFIAAFTTSLARLKLYEALDFLGDRVLYYDTDSVIYKTKRGQENCRWSRIWDNLRTNLTATASSNSAVAGPRTMATSPRKVKSNAKCVGFLSIMRQNKP